MAEFGRRIRPFVDAELAVAAECERRGEGGAAFNHLERAHVLGQASTREHVRVHLKMLRWAIRDRNGTEIAGQPIRIAGAAAVTAIGLVPTGNTGGARVKAWRRLEVPPDLAELISRARAPRP